MGINSRDKGARYERETAKYLQGFGYDASRSAQWCGKTGQADVIGLPKIHIECKHYKNRAFDYTWMDQAKRDARPGEIPVVFHKKNNAEVLVTLTLDGFMQIYKDFELEYLAAERYRNEQVRQYVKEGETDA